VLLLAATVLRQVSGPGDAPNTLAVLGGLVLLPLALALYPDDRPPPSWGWWSLAPVLATGLLSLLYPDTYAASGLGGLVVFLLLMVLLWWRHAHAAPDADSRSAILWIALGGGTATMLGTLAGFAMPDAEAGPALVLGVVAVAAVGCLVVGLVAPEVRDVRSATVTTAVHLVTALLVVSVFSMVLAAAEVWSGAQPASPGSLGIIAAVLAAAYHPVSTLLRGVTDLLLFGERRRPLEAVSDLGERLSQGPEQALLSLRESLALPYAALVDGAGTTVAASGNATTRLFTTVLRPSAPGQGRLVVGLRTGEVVLPSRDQELLAVVGPALAQLLNARSLGEALQVSRTEVVLAVEEERRRLRRDLHDGLGPRLTGVAYTADAARNSAGDPARVLELLAGLRADAGDAIAEVRRLVDGLRPPSLDQIGLVEALRQHGRSLHGANGHRLEVSLDVEEPLGPLEAAVEVATYRIVVEALTNAARHSRGSHCQVLLARNDGTLVIEVSDNGSTTGLWLAGVGMSSMRDRAEVLGGDFSAGAGTVRVTLPV